MVLTFGKYKGIEVKDCPENYVRWLATGGKLSNGGHYNVPAGIVEEAKELVAKMQESQEFVCDADNILALFEPVRNRARLKYPKLSFDECQLQLNSDRSQYPDDINVVIDRSVVGRISREHKKYIRYKPNEAVEALLVALNAAPKIVCAECGKASGRCCFCGLELTTDESLSAGYGPRCAENYHLPWGGKTNAKTF